MKPVPPQDWQPDPQLLAAYFDGELAGRVDLRERLEAWLEQHPEAFAEHERLREAWEETAPCEPAGETWNQLLNRIDESRRRQPRQTARTSQLALAVAALAVLLITGSVLVGMWFAGRPDAPVQVAANVNPAKPAQDDDMTPLPVATAGEVVILNVEGEDTASLVVGELPLHGKLELSAPGDIFIVRVQPDAQDQMLPRIRLDDQNRLIIWARIDTEED